MNRYKNRDDIAIAREIVSCPGDTLAEHLEHVGMSQAELAQRMGRPKKTINEIIKGKAQITPETALQLELVVGIPATFWLNREQNYRLRLAEIDEAERLLDEADWAKRFPVREMLEKEWIVSEEAPGYGQGALLSFFGVANPKSYEEYYLRQVYAPACRMSDAGGSDADAMAAWLRQGERQAEAIQAPAFDKKAFEGVLEEIGALVRRDDAEVFRELTARCLDAGVKVVYTPFLKKAPVQGATRWLKGSPLIQLSNRRDRNDIFWFTFCHEAAHILKHRKNAVFIEGVDHPCDGREMEAEADAFAEKCLLDSDAEREIMESGSYGKEDIERYAGRYETHPAIIAGRLAERGVVEQQHGQACGFFRKMRLNP